MATDTEQFFGFSDPSTPNGDYNVQRFMIWQQMMNLNTSMPVEVLSVQATGVAPVGLVSIRVLVDQITGDDMTIPHGEIPNVPYFRLQGGTNAVIIDPQVGDIGLACFCSRDISSVKNSRKNAPPGSRRAYDFSDAMYSGGFLNKTPVQYIHFTDSGILVHSPHAVKVEAETVDVQASMSATVTAQTIDIKGSNRATFGAPITAISGEEVSVISSGERDLTIGSPGPSGVNLGNINNAVRELIDARMVAAFNSHTHQTAGSVPFVQLSINDVATKDTKAN